MPSTSDIQNDYVSCRTHFRALAAMAGFVLEQVRIPGYGIQGEELTQDYAYLDKGSDTTLVHISGVHGVEGYLGSAIQRRILQNTALLKSLRCNILFVHAVNPYGMSFCRRTNGNNVDLNRNSVFGLRLPTNPDAATLQNFLRSHSRLEIALRFPQLLLRALYLGPRKISQAIAGGQWEFPHSLFYGGRELQAELSALVAKLQALTGKSRRLCVLDVHTGLGPFAYDSLLASLNQHQQISFFSEATAVEGEKSHVLDLTKPQEMYHSQGSLDSLLLKHFVGKEIFYLVQEFGTKSALSVLFSLILENSAFQNQSMTAMRRKEILLESFFPSSEKWRTTCLELGEQRFTQIASKLCGEIVSV